MDDLPLACMTKQSQIFQNIIRPKRTLEPLGGPISGFFSAAGFCARRERRIGSFSRQSLGTNFVSFNLVKSFRARPSQRSRSMEISKIPTARVSSVSHAPQQLRPRRERWSRFYGSSSAWDARKKRETRLNYSRQSRRSHRSRVRGSVVVVGSVVVGSVVRSFSRIHPSMGKKF